MEIDEYFHIYFHSFTIYVLDEKDGECEISCRIKHFHEVPGWRNWQTQRTQNALSLTCNSCSSNSFKYMRFGVTRILCHFVDLVSGC